MSYLPSYEYPQPRGKVSPAPYVFHDDVISVEKLKQ